MTSLPLSQAFAFRMSPAAGIPMAEQSRMMMALEIRMAEAMATKEPKIVARTEGGPTPESMSKSIAARRASCAARRKIQHNKLIAAMRRRGPQTVKQLAPVINISPSHTSSIVKQLVADGTVHVVMVDRLAMYSVAA